MATPQTPKQAVRQARDLVATELANARAYLQKAVEERQNCQQRVNTLQNQLSEFDAWLLANP